MRSSAASSTATLIARCLLLADWTSSLRPLLSPTSAALTRQFLAVAQPVQWLDFALRHSWTRRLLFAVEEVLLPGIILHYLARKCLLETHARAAISSGIRQIVILGSGLDTLAWRLHDEEISRTFELDHPATQSIKRRVPLPPGPVLLAADLACDAPSTLLQECAGFVCSLPTLFIAEGLLMYFPERKVSAILSDLAGIASAGSQLAFTFMEENRGRPIGFRGGNWLIDKWLQHQREPFLWAMNRESISDFLSPLGWRKIEISTPSELRSQFLVPHGLGSARLAEGESVVLAQLVSP